MKTNTFMFMAIAMILALLSLGTAVPFTDADEVDSTTPKDQFTVTPFHEAVTRDYGGLQIRAIPNCSANDTSNPIGTCIDGELEVPHDCTRQPH